MMLRSPFQGLNFILPVVDSIAYVQSLKEIAIEVPDQAAITIGKIILKVCVAGSTAGRSKSEGTQHKTKFGILMIFLGLLSARSSSHGRAWNDIHSLISDP